jgi:hypothetical protein
MFADRSEVDLNERLNLARKNSNILAYSPAKPPRSPMNGLIPVNTTMPSRGDSGSKSPGPRLNGHSDLGDNEDTPIARRQPVDGDSTDALREASEFIEYGRSDSAVRCGSPVSSATAPLRIRNKTPSPVRTDTPLSPRLNGPRSPIGPRGPSLRNGRSPSPVHSPVAQPLAIPTRTMTAQVTTYTSTTLSSSVPITPAKYPGLGSSHTRLRLVSGGGRKVSPGRETVPLRDNPSPQPRRVSAKRQHSEDHLQQPRKRSDSRSPLHPVDLGQVVDPSPIPSLSIKRGTPTKLSGISTPVRGNSLRSSISEKVPERVEYVDAGLAIEAARQKVSFFVIETS